MMRNTKRAQRVGTVVAVGFLVAFPWRAQAQDYGRTPDESVRAGADLYFRQFVQPLIAATQERAIRDYHNPALYQRFDNRGPAEPIPERKVWRHPVAGLVVVANEAPPASASVPVSLDDCSDPTRREMFRVYFQ